jgi:hypothetical protein
MSSASRFADDTLLDQLAAVGDADADAAVAALVADGGIESASWVFRAMKSNTDQVPDTAPAPIHAFVEAHRGLPSDLDQARIERGAAVFLSRPVASSLVLSVSSLPRIFAAPRLSQVLAISGNLSTHAYRRSLGVLQMLINICRDDAFVPGGRAVVAGQKMRLLHAGIRHLVPKYRPEYAARFGRPLTLEDMLFTSLQFSYFVIDGLRRLGQRLSDQDAEDYFYLWRIFSLQMGIYPPGKPHDDSWVPADLTDAAAFNAAYVRRHGAEAKDNKEGVDLTQAQLAMLRGMIPTGLRFFGLGVIPRIAMTEALDPADQARVGISPVVGQGPIKAMLPRILRLLDHDHLPRDLAEAIGLLLFKGLVQFGRGGPVTFTIPDDLQDLRGKDFV